ncbi:MAG TPA: hypothetical protein VK203_01475 [Nostocaceae cyanobacterium]|nr:hypothetical protein [Nostocaceae cyanobacterium]
MILTTRQFQNLNQHTLGTIPEHLQILFNKIKQEHYEELYEQEADGTASLENDLRKVLEAFRPGKSTVSHLQYIWMTLILILAVEPTLQFYNPTSYLPKKIINLIVLWIGEISFNLIENITISSTIIDELVKEIFKDAESYFARKKGVNYQSISEALDVFYNALRVLNYDQSVEAILEILYDCLEGYAIFPGSYGRRELFDWWLLEVVPASWYLLPPKSFYVVEGLQNKEEIKLRQTRLLEKISSEIWYPVLREIGYNRKAQYNTLLNPYTPVIKFNHSIDVKINSGNNFNASSNARIINFPENTLSVCFV